MLKHKQVTAMFLAVLLTLTATLSAPAPAAAGASIEAELQAQLSAAGATAQLELVVNYDPAVTSGNALAKRIRGLGAKALAFQRVRSVAAIATPGQILSIANMDGVTGLYSNALLEYYLSESVPFIGADRAWADLGVTGNGVGVAIIDTGIDATHPDLAFGSKTVQNVKIVADVSAAFADDDLDVSVGARARVFLEDQLNTDTSSGHGTHVAGIAAGTGAASNGSYTGVAKGANLIGIGAGDVLFIFWALAGFDYVLANHERYNIRVVNNSWGSTRQAARFDPEHPINRASKQAAEEGITVVFSAGNSGPGPDTMNHYAMPDWVIAVAAGCVPGKASRCSDGLLADFSSRGTPDGTVRPTLTGPGVFINSTRASTGATINALTARSDLTVCRTQFVTHYTCASGTSMAAPHVTGVVALMQAAAGGKLSPAKVKKILVATARPMFRNDGTPFATWEVGAGYLDAFEATKASLR